MLRGIILNDIMFILMWRHQTYGPGKHPRDHKIICSPPSKAMDTDMTLGRGMWYPIQPLPVTVVRTGAPAFQGCKSSLRAWKIDEDMKNPMSFPAPVPVLPIHPL